MKKCVAYARYSSHAQKDTSIEDQVRDIQAYCKFNNLELVQVYADRHLSGTTDQRPQFQQMLKDAAHGGWEFVVVWKTDRFARNRYDSATYKYRLKKHGVRVLSAKESIPDGPEGILLEAILEGSAEYYSANLAQNVRRGMRANALECKINNGSPPYGYCKGPDGRFAIVEPEAEIVREIFQRVAQGAKFVDISDSLNRRGIRTKKGREWNRSSFQTIMRNEIYIGVYKYDDIRIEGGTPAIVDKATFLEAQAKMEEFKRVRNRHHKGSDDYILTGKLFCGHCGTPMSGMSGHGKSGAKHHYYVCRKSRVEHACPKKNVRRDVIEDQVIRYALEVVLQPDTIEWMADQIMDFQEHQRKSPQVELLNARLTDTVKQRDNVLKAIRAGIITKSTQALLEQLEKEVEEIEECLFVEEARSTYVERDFVVFWLSQFRTGDQSNQEFRQKIVDTFIQSVHLFDDHLRISFNFTGQQSTIDRSLILSASPSTAPSCSLNLPTGAPLPPYTNPTLTFIGCAFVLISALNSNQSRCRK